MTAFIPFSKSKGSIKYKDNSLRHNVNDKFLLVLLLVERSFIHAHFILNLYKHVELISCYCVKICYLLFFLQFLFQGCFEPLIKTEVILKGFFSQAHIGNVLFSMGCWSSCD